MSEMFWTWLTEWLHSFEFSWVPRKEQVHQCQWSEHGLQGTQAWHETIQLAESLGCIEELHKHLCLVGRKTLWFSSHQNTKPRKSRLFWAVFDNTLPTSQQNWAGRFGPIWMDFCKSFLFCHGFGHFQPWFRIISACTSPPDCRILTSVQSCQPKPQYFG